MKKANALLVKSMNQNLVRRQLLSQKAATKQQLAQLTGLSLMTTSSIIIDKMSNGEIIEGNMIPSSGGRPSAEYCYNGGYRHAVILLGYQKNNRNFIRMRVLNMFGSCVYTEEQYFGTVFCDSFDEMLARAFTSFGDIGIIGFGLPGEEENGIITINDYPNLVGDRFMKRYRERYKIPVIFVNDVNASVLGYFRRNNGCQRLKGTVAGPMEMG